MREVEAPGKKYKPRPKPVLITKDVDPNRCKPTRPGLVLQFDQPCPFCKEGLAAYDNNLNLYCPACGKVQTGTYT
jgi:hypothetical protein